jgi:hypothetical protein
MFCGSISSQYIGWIAEGAIYRYRVEMLLATLIFGRLVLAPRVPASFSHRIGEVEQGGRPPSRPPAPP